MTDPDSYILEIVCTDSPSTLIIQEMECYTPHVIQFYIGHIQSPRYQPKLVAGLLDSLPHLKDIILPTYIPTTAIQLLSPLLDLPRVNYHYLEQNQTALSQNLYEMKMGYFPEDVQQSTLNNSPFLYHDISSVPCDGTAPNPTGSQGIIDHPESPIQFDGTNYIPSDGQIVPGFHELPDLPEHDTDGFHDWDKYKKKETDDSDDGFHDLDEVPIERREMWSEDPARMNRLSYQPIAEALHLDHYPPELGGGSIK